MLHHLMALAADDRAPQEVRAIAWGKLDQLKKSLPSLYDQREHSAYAVEQITQFQKNPKELKLPPSVEIPEGQPIGMDGGVYGGMSGAPFAPWFCDPER